MAGFWLFAIAGCQEPSRTAQTNVPVDLDVDSDGYDTPDDCDDGNPDVHPGAEELCDGDDNDCDGSTDVGAVDAPLHWPDADGDGYGAGTGVAACATPDGMADNGDDCNDARIDAHPGGIEVCDDDDVDQDCDGLTDDEDDGVAPDTTTSMYADADGDGFGDIDTSIRACELIEGWALDWSDCDDTRDTVYPDAKEVCNDGVDNDCDVTSNLCRRSGEYTIADAEVVITGEHHLDYLGENADSAGDLDGDGDQDLLVGGIPSVYVVLGPVSSMGSSGAHARIDGDDEADAFGAVMVGLGDQDGDGYDDVVLAAWGYDNNAGRVYALMGPLSGTSTVGAIAAATITGEGEDYFGNDVSSGDVNGDGVLDLLASAVGQNGKAGGAYLYDGPLTVGDLTLSAANASFVGTDEGDALGFPVAANGDVDGDGIDDVLLGASLDSEDGGRWNGSAWLFYGPTAGAHTVDDVDVLIHGAGSHAQLGWPLSSGGDLDGDGRDDLVLSACQASMSEGQVYVFSATTVSATSDLEVGAADATITGQKSDQIAYALDSAGDLDADGRDDVIIGSVFAGDFYQGAAWGFYGPVTGDLDVGSDASFSVVGVDVYDEVGGVVALVRDVTGDGVDDLALGRPGAVGSDGTYQGDLRVFEGMGK